jgi:hypothetical protein
MTLLTQGTLREIARGCCIALAATLTSAFTHPTLRDRTSTSAIVELVDSTSGEVIHQLDSFAISASQPYYDIAVEPTLDLLSGTNYVRMRFASSEMPSGGAMGDSRYPIAEVSESVSNPGYGKLRRVDNRPEATARISASPNPFNASADIRFSISIGGYVDVKVHDRLGREIAHLVRHEWMEPGRYEIAFERADLEPGTYVLELRAGDLRAVTKVVRVR